MAIPQLGDKDIMLAYSKPAPVVRLTNDSCEGAVKRSRRAFLPPLVGALLLGSALGAFAQSTTYPTKPITIVVGFSAGGGADALARLLGKSLSTRLGQSVVVENRPGAGASIAAAAVATAQPDGHTLLLMGSGHPGTKVLYPAWPHDPVKSFTPIAKLAATPSILLVKQDSPLKSMADVITLARSKPGAIPYAAGGGGATVTMMTAENFKQEAKVSALFVPYRGSAPALMALLAGDVAFGFDLPSSALSQIQAGKLRALAVSSKERFSLLSDTPTFAEQGLAGFDIKGWFGVIAPAGVAAPIVNRLSKEITEIIKQPETAKQLAALALEADALGSAEFRHMLERETARSTTMIEKFGLKAD